MALVRARRRAAVSRESRRPDPLLWRPRRIPRLATTGADRRAESLAGGVPRRGPFRRFPLAAGVTPGDHGRYIDALSAYFRTDPYRNWFRHFEPLLNGASASYYPGETSTGLHTDICSTVATNPTWSSLTEAERATLEGAGGPLWHALVETLRPHVVTEPDPVLRTVASGFRVRSGAEPSDPLLACP